MDNRSVQSRANILAQIWNGVVISATVVAGFLIPYELNMHPKQNPLPLPVDWGISVIFALDFLEGLWGCRRAIRESKDPRRLRVFARWIPRIFVDALAVIPLARVTGINAIALVRLLKILRLARLLRLHRGENPLHTTATRLGGFLLWVTLAVHWLACGWMALRPDDPSIDATTTYFDALYWCITTIATVGYGDITPKTVPEKVYAMLTMALGVAVTGYVVGNFANLLVRADMIRADYDATLDRLSGFLRYRNVPPDVQHRIFAYYDYLWERRMGFDESKVLGDLPPTLREELSWILKEDLIHKVPFLHDASARLVRELTALLKPVVFIPGDLVVQRGERGTRMFFVGRGKLEVLGPDEITVIKVLNEGDFFGELSLIREQPRNATVRAADYCDLYVLERQAFDQFTERHPAFAAHLHEVARARGQTETPSESEFPTFPVPPDTPSITLEDIKKNEDDE